MQDERGYITNRSDIIRNVLPKANQIVDIQQQVKRTIYPFKMIHHLHHISDYVQSSEQYITTTTQQIKFIPPKATIISHFSKQFLIYDKFNSISDDELFNCNIFSIERLKNLRNNDYVMSTQFTKQFQREDNLTFDSRFQSGNLSLVSKVDGLYSLLLHNDVNTEGYTNWFYFSVKCNKPGTYKFAIMNYGKAGWPYNNGTGICTYSQKAKQKRWRRGGINIQCQPNKKIYSGYHYLNHFNTLSFEFNFDHQNQKIFFSYNIPYTYTSLCSLLDTIQSKKLPYFYRKLAGRSLAGNRLEMLTITNYEASKSQTQELPVIVMLGRSHSGETVSSWMIQSFIQFIVSEDASARILRDNFIFKIFPMVNPDGVIHGNYRCSLSGRDLNRRWTKPSKDLFPEVYYIKNQILEISKNRNIKLILDMHGHSQKKKVFIYGCNEKLQPHKCRLFPYIMSKVCQHFDFNLCNFSIDKSKLSTARITLFHTLKLSEVFTIQSSQYGTFIGHLNNNILKQVGQSIGKCLIIYFKPKNTTQQPELQKIMNERGNFEQQLLGNQQLLQSGNNADSGSQRQPSVDNIGFEKLAKMTSKKQGYYLKVASNKKISKTIEKNGKQNLKEQIKFYQKPKTPQIRSYTRQNNREISTTNGPRPKIINSTMNQKSFIQKEKISQPNFTSPRASQKTQVLKLINFSLSINDQTSYTGRLISKMPIPNYFGEHSYKQTPLNYRDLVKVKSHSKRNRQ